MKIFFIPINSPLKRIKSINCTKCNLYIFYFRYILQLLPSAEVKIQNTKKKKKDYTNTIDYYTSTLIDYNSETH